MKGWRRGTSSFHVPAASLFSMLLGVACRGGEGRPVERPRPSLVSEVSALPAFVSPAVWRYHPSEPARINAVLTLPSAARVLAGRRGERWISSPGRAELEAASVLAPEDLVGISQTPSGSFIFVGASGVSYEASSPVGPFFRSTAPLEPLASVTSAGSVILGIRRDRGLLRSEDAGATWRPVGSSRSQNSPRFVSVALGGSGNGLALAVPEELFETHDAGQSFAPLAVRSVGAFALERLPDGSLGVSSALGPFRYRPGAREPLESMKGTVFAPSSDLKAPRGPDAQALSEGRAATTSDSYFELGLRNRAAWQLTRGPLTGPFTSRELPELSACRAVRLAAFEHSLRVACFRAGAEAATQSIELWRSDDGGQSLYVEERALSGNLAGFRMALGAEGALLFAGVCPLPGAPVGCAPQGIGRRVPLLRKPSGVGASAPKRHEASAFAMAPAATPSLADTALALAFSLDGRIAYAVARRNKGGGLGVFVSRDGGRSFEAQELNLPQGDGSGGDERWESSAAGVRVDALVPAEDGTVGLVVSRYRSRVWLVLDEAGRVLSVARPPDSRAVLAVAGSRALAVSPSNNDVWESLDGGASFRSLPRLPIDLCPSESGCEVSVACAPSGCAIGSELSRLGWGGHGDDDVWTQPTLAPAPVDYSVPRLKTPIACSLDASAWQGLAHASEFPSAREAAIGKAHWFVSAQDSDRAAVFVWVASGTGNIRVERQVLLPPTDRGRSFALYVSDQVEGVAALRYQVPEVSGVARLLGLELGWINLLEGRTRRVAVGDGGPYAPGDFSRGARGLQVANPALLSIAEGGIYLRLHQAAADNQPTQFFDGQRVENIPAVAWPTLGVRGTHSEMAHVEGQHVPLLLIGRGSGVVRARIQAGQQELDAFASGALDPARFGLTQTSNIAYVGSRAGQVIETFDSASAQARAQLFPFRAGGAVLDPPVDVPTQLSMADRVERCSPSAEATTPRIVAAPYPGTRHPVIVSDGGDTPQAFLTGYAVMHGTPATPCVSAFDGEPVVPDGVAAPKTSVLLPLGDLSRAYLFRKTVLDSEVRLEYHLLSCKFDPTAEVPPELYRAPGALVPRLR